MPSRGYLDLVAAEYHPPTGVAQRLMHTRLVPAVYERWWRPALGRIAKGPRGPSMAEELRLVRGLLSLSPGDTVLDAACGPGNVARALADDVGATGTVVGVDMSSAMLSRAVADTAADNVVYVRADIAELTLRPASVDAVSCLAALHLFADPGAALDVMARALAPGGRLAVLTTARPAGRVAARAARLAGRAAGTAVFGTDELAAELTRRDLVVTARYRFATMQLLGARRSAADGDAAGSVTGAGRRG